MPSDFTPMCIERAMAEAAQLGIAASLRKEVYQGPVCVVPAFDVRRFRRSSRHFTLPVGNHDRWLP